MNNKQQIIIMKRYISQLGHIAFLMTLAFCLVSCGDDEEEVKSKTTDVAITGGVVDVYANGAEIEGSVNLNLLTVTYTSSELHYGVEVALTENFASARRFDASELVGTKFRVTVVGLSPKTKYFYRTYVRVQTLIYYGTTYSFTTEEEPTSYIHEYYVDLDLPSGTLWATCNIGADTPEDYGLYFAWGETTGYTQDYSDGHSFDWISYKYAINDGNTLTKYCNDSSYGYNGFTDTLTELEPEDDAAYVNWGSEWRMPSLEQIQELNNRIYTTTEWTSQNGVYGIKITSKSNNNSIFLPAAGWCYDSSLNDVGDYGDYWSRTLYTSGPYNACSLYFIRGGVSWGSRNRSDGQSVRPVRVSQ